MNKKLKEKREFPTAIISTNKDSVVKSMAIKYRARKILIKVMKLHERHAITVMTKLTEIVF